MSQAEAVRAVGRLIAAFRKDSIPEDTAALYAEKLADVPGPLLRTAIERLIDTRTFFPAIAEIRVVAAELAGLLPPSSAEALAIIRRADRGQWRGGRDGTRGYFEKTWDWPEDLSDRDLEIIQGVLAKVGEPSDPEGKPHFGWEMGFQRDYEKASEVARREVLADLSRARLQSGAIRQLSAAREPNRPQEDG